MPNPESVLPRAAADAVPEPNWRMYGQRYKVFAIIVLVNFTVWLDEGIFGALTPFWSKDLHLTNAQIGTGSAAYLLTDFIMLFVGGVLADIWGARRMLIVVVVGCALLSGAMLVVHDYDGLVLRNLAFGVFFGPLWAPCNRLIALWLPPHERAKSAAVWMSSTLFSFVVANPLGLLIAERLDWRAAFLLVSLLSVPALLLLLWTRERPEQLKSVSAAELTYICRGRDISRDLDADRFHLKDLRKAVCQWSVLAMIIATALATTPTWLILTWGTYGLVDGFKLGSARASTVSALFLMVPVVYGFAHGWVVNHLFGGRCRPALALGPIISGLGFLSVGYFAPGYAVWAFLVFGIGFLADPFFWGSVNAYWAGLTKPEYLGTLSGLSAACQVAVGYLIISTSGHWVRADVAGPTALANIWLYGGVIFLAAAIPVFLSREVRAR